MDRKDGQDVDATTEINTSQQPTAGKTQKVLVPAENWLTDDHPNIHKHDFIAVLPGAFYDFLIFCFMCHAINSAPYTKVEESFNVQAIHDLMIIPGTQLETYDHLAFPGVVPRTFLGPLFIKFFTQPVVSLMTADGKSQISLDWYLYIARTALALLSVHSLRLIRLSTAHVFGHTVSAFFGIFHLIFWGSRYIPNTFAMILVNYGISCWISSWKPVTRKEIIEKVKERDRIFGSPPMSLGEKGTRKIRVKKSSVQEPPISMHSSGMIFFILFAAIVFRLEILAVLLPILVSEIFIYKTIKFIPALIACAVTGIISVTLTTTVDTIFWKSSSLLWPELQGRSKEYGTNPPHFYFSNLLLRIATVAYPLAIYAVIVDSRVRRLLAPALFFVCIMSFVGHKEWRFVFPIVPIVNLAAAIGLTRIFRIAYLRHSPKALSKPERPSSLSSSSSPLDVTSSFKVSRRDRVFHKIILLALSATLLASLLFTNVSIDISSRNYPGGVAMEAIHKFLKVKMAGDSRNELRPYLHMDVYTCQTGASRFMELGRNDGWRYSKEEGLQTDAEFVERGFTHLLTTTPELHVGEDWEKSKDRDDTVWEVVPGYIHGLKKVKLEFGPGGWKAWLGQSLDKVIKGNLKWKPKLFYYGIKLPIEVYMEPKIFLLKKK
ncbi:hypothetical protein HK100_002204 [Physocladia obscura]|uniref:Mannosyltransferase n=1 Tax=Physocladia obscura TaxID=109957 RepID=A0AAD5T7D0_9FUNG|nr:hypothetical protein HK100_002204 [Physocladia obscura]